MTQRIIEDVLVGLMQAGVNDQKILGDVRQVMQMELVKYDIKHKETSIVIRDNSDMDILTRFFVAKASAGLSPRTLKAYKDGIQRSFLKIGKNIKSITTDDVRAYLTKLRMDGVTLVSIDNERRYMSTFFNWAFEEGFLFKNPMKRIEKVRSEKKVKKPFSEDEMELLRIYANSERNRAIIEFLYSTGCRVAEVEQLNRRDIDFDKREATVKGKGNKERRVFLSPRCVAVLTQYLSKRKDKNPALFTSNVSWEKDDNGVMKRTNKPTRLLMSGIENVVKQAGKRAGVENSHPHRIRRTCATIALRRGMPIEQVSKMLGHSSIETTTIYASSTMDEVKQSHDKYLT